jgi:hypothetical protein
MTRGVATTEAPGEFPAQLTFALHVEGFVDGLVTELHVWLLWERYRQAPSDLLRRPKSFKIRPHSHCQWRVAQLLRLGSLSALASTTVCGPDPVVRSPPVGTNLSRDGEGGTMKLTGNSTQ